MTYFFVPDKTGVDLADEDAEFMKYLAENGWGGEVGEDDEVTIVDQTGYPKSSLEKDGIDEEV